jgi:hypothetical protein
MGVKTLMKLINILEHLETLGLQYNLQTGGHFVPSERYKKVRKTESVEEYEIIGVNGEKTPILDGRVFLKSVTTTEDALKIKLFV